MTTRASMVPCLAGLPIARPVDEPIPLMLVVSCDHYLTQPRNCRGACVAGHKASVDQCNACTDYTPQALPSVAKRVGGFTQAMASLVAQEPPTAQEQAARLDVCAACPQFARSADEADYGHCKACGCPQTRMSSLRVKAAIRRSSCPLHLWQ